MHLTQEAVGFVHPDFPHWGLVEDPHVVNIGGSNPLPDISKDESTMKSSKCTMPRYEDMRHRNNA